MAMDPAVENLLTVDLVTDSRHSGGLTRMVDRNLSQGLGVIHDTVIQSNAGVKDDAATFAAFSTASRIPSSGALPKT